MPAGGQRGLNFDPGTGASSPIHATGGGPTAPAAVRASGTTEGYGWTTATDLTGVQPKSLGTTRTIQQPVEPATGFPAIAPDAINATSAMSASVVRLRPVTPASISSTSNVTATVVRLRPVTPATISSTSNVSASIVRQRRILGATISATSTISAAVVRLRRILGGSISATSALSATLSKAGLQQIAPASIITTSTITGAVTRLPGVVVSHRPTLTLTTSSHGTLAGSPETRATLASSSATRGSLGSELGYGSAIPDSDWALPDFMIPDDEDTTDWMRDEADLTPSPSTRAPLTPA